MWLETIVSDEIMHVYGAGNARIASVAFWCCNTNSEFLVEWIGLLNNMLLLTWVDIESLTCFEMCTSQQTIFFELPGPSRTVSSTISSRPSIVSFSDYPLIYDIVYFLPDLLPPSLSPSGLRSNISGNRFKIPFARTNQYKNSFICTVTQLWNKAINCTNFTLFKQLIYPLFSYYRITLSISY